ncbi:MAG: hypothetical protein KC983_10035 [Phycisphaerales bacterium]|nr:hypothetical protein [Phycisphaerales bacterium]
MGSQPLIIRIARATSTTLPEIVAAMRDPAQWRTFTGWGPLPGIRDVVIERESESFIGTTFRVTNTDGSQHTETVREWDGVARLVIEMHDFPRPLSWVAKGFIERWTQDTAADEASRHVLVRTVEMHPASWWGRIMLYPVRVMIKRALLRHTGRILA